MVERGERWTRFILWYLIVRCFTLLVKQWSATKPRDKSFAECTKNPCTSLVLSTMAPYCENIDCDSPTMETMPSTSLPWRHLKKRASSRVRLVCLTASCFAEVEIPPCVQYITGSLSNGVKILQHTSTLHLVVGTKKIFTLGRFN